MTVDGDLGFVRLSTKLMINTWAVREIRNYRRSNKLRNVLAKIAKEKSLHLGTIYEHLIWPFEDAGVDIFEILSGRVGFKHYTSIIADGLESRVGVMS